MTNIKIPVILISNLISIPKKLFDNFKEFFEQHDKKDIEIIITSPKSNLAERTFAKVYIVNIKNNKYAKLYIRSKKISKEFKGNFCYIIIPIKS